MILVAGSANLDFVVRASHIPAPGETVLGQSFQTFPGGKGANQAVACARAGGARTDMLLATGEDAYAEPLLASLKAAGVGLHRVACKELATGCAFICVSDDAENAISVAPGANAALSAHHLPDLSGVSHLLMQLEIPLPTVMAYAVQARKHGVQVVLNAAPAQALPTGLLDAVDLLVVNEGELATLAQCPGSISDNLRQVSVPTVVVTLGHRGCVARQGDVFTLQPAVTVKAVDTTGAGDTFCGTLVAALSQGEGLAQAMAKASAAAALACTRPGAQSSVPSASEVTAMCAASDTASDTASEAAVRALRAYCGLPD